MTYDFDGVDRSDGPNQVRTTGSPFRRLTPSGSPAWHSPPQPQPVEVIAAAPATIAAPLDWPPNESGTTELVAPRSRFTAAAIAGLVSGVVLLALVVGGAYAAYQALLGHDDLATAAYAPPDSWAYVAVNVDPTSQAWLDAWNLAKRAGIDDELARIPEEGLSDSGEDPAVWETLIKPAVGRELGFAVWPNPAGADDEPFVAAIVMIADQDKAQAALDELLDDESADETTYRDIEYQTNLDGSAAGIVDDALILTSTAEGFEAIVDARRDGALDGVAGFTSAADRAADDPLVFAYVNGTSIGEAIASLQDEFQAGPDAMMFTGSNLTDSLDFYTDFGQMTLTVTADDNALRTEILTEGRPANFPMVPAGNAFVDRMPASTLFYVASADLHGTIFAPILDQYETMFDPAGSEGANMMPTPYDVETMLGFDLEDDLLAQFNGPYAVSVNVDESGGEYGGQFHFYSEVADPVAVTRSLDSLADSVGEMADLQRIVGGYRIDVPRRDMSLEVTVEGDILHLAGSYRLSDADGSLASDPAFRAAMAEMPSNPTFAGYFATDRLWDLLPADAWADSEVDARETVESFQSIAFATAPDGDGTRTLFVMTVGE